MQRIIYFVLVFFLISGCSKSRKEASIEQRTWKFCSSFIFINVFAYYPETNQILDFRVDSAGIFFANTAPKGKSYYGVLPDSIFNIVQQYVAGIQADTTVKYPYLDSLTHDFLAIEIASRMGTVQIRQNPIDMVAKELFISPMEKYFRKDLSRQYQMLYMWWTRPDFEARPMNLPLPDSLKPECRIRRKI